MLSEYIASERMHSAMMDVAMSSTYRQDNSTAFIHFDLRSKIFTEVVVFAAACTSAEQRRAANQRADLPTVAAGSFFAL